jgi:hypothetical protein
MATELAFGRMVGFGQLQCSVRPFGRAAGSGQQQQLLLHWLMVRSSCTACKLDKNWWFTLGTIVLMRAANF